MNLEQELAKLDEEHRKKRAELARAAALLDALPDFAKVREPRIHLHRLYGRQVSLTWDFDFYAPFGKATWQPDAAFLLRLAEALGRPLPVVQVRAGCLSFRLAEHVAELPEEDKQRWEEERPVSPFLVKLSAFQHRTAEISWAVRLAGLAAEIRVVLPRLDDFGRLDLLLRDVKGGRRVERCAFNPDDRLITLFRDEEPVAELQSPIKWASGTPDVPNSFTLFWVDLRPDVPSHVVDLARALQPE